MSEQKVASAGFFKKHFKLLVLIVAIIVVVAAGYAYYRYSELYPSTDDAYVHAHVVNVSTQVEGQVAEVNVDDHQAVKKGQLLFAIDPQQYQYQLNKAQAALALQKAQVASSEQAVKVAQANLEKAKAQYGVAQKKAQRTLKLVAQNLASKQEGDNVAGAEQEAQASVQAAQESVGQAEQTLQTQKAQVKVDEAQVQIAQLNLAHTKIYSPTTGVVSNFSLQPGDYVQPGVQLFAIVDTQQWWVKANFKETQLDRIQPGQTASITIDMYPGLVLKGVVQSVSRGSGTSFSLLPPENATGNWVKVTQRFPVKIAIPADQIKAHFPLRVGASTSVTVDTA